MNESGSISSYIYLKILSSELGIYGIDEPGRVDSPYFFIAACVALVSGHLPR